jgi:hypothetical protein
MTGISSMSMPILAVAILLLLEDGALVVAASAAIEGKRHQTMPGGWVANLPFALRPNERLAGVNLRASTEA